MAKANQLPEPHDTPLAPPVLSEDLVFAIEDDREINRGTQNGDDDAIAADESADNNALVSSVN